MIYSVNHSPHLKVHESIFPDVSQQVREKWVGTVHTMQGKEADVIILILGGDPDRPGARGFATREPYLLNVAVTRAKRRLYVIGNRVTWGNEPYFDVLDARIPLTVTGNRYRASIALTLGGHRSELRRRGLGSPAQTPPRTRR
jgi:AAA domain-containing protein